MSVKTKHQITFAINGARLGTGRSNGQTNTILLDFARQIQWRRVTQRGETPVVYIPPIRSAPPGFVAIPQPQWAHRIDLLHSRTYFGAEDARKNLDREHEFLMGGKPGLDI